MPCSTVLQQFFLELKMIFTVSVDFADGGSFEYSTESILKFLRAAQMMGNTDIEEVEDDEDSDFEAFSNCFEEGEEYEFDHDAGCYCWYDCEYDAWYWLDEDTNEWLLVEEESDDEEEEDEELEAA
jgi:hypothetical protein